MGNTRSALVGFTATVAAVGLLVGCGSGGDDLADTSSTPDTTATVETTVSVETTAPIGSTTTVLAAESADAGSAGTDSSTTEAPIAEAPATTEAPAEGDCLIGDWVVTDEQMNLFYAGAIGTLQTPLTIDTVGSAPLTFGADGTYSWTPDFVLTVDVAGQSGVGDVGGTITGNWTAVDGIVTTSADVNDLTVSITVNGATFGGDDLANGLLDSSPVNGVTYACDGPVPVLDFKTADPEVTVPVTLTPA
jgi:hypothetical protein